MADATPKGYLSVGEARDLVVARLYRGVALPDGHSRLPGGERNVAVGAWRRRAAQELIPPIRDGVIKVFGWRPGSPKPLRLLPITLTEIAYLTERHFLVLRPAWVRGQVRVVLTRDLLAEKHLLQLCIDEKSLLSWLHAAASSPRWRAHRRGEATRPPGRPSKLGPAVVLIKRIVSQKKWHAGMPLKTLVDELQRKGLVVGPDAVGRAVDKLYDLTKQEVFRRARHRRKPRRTPKVKKIMPRLRRR